MTRRFTENCVVFLLILCNGPAILGATINVPADQATIQAGINAAVSGADEVVVAPGTYDEIIDFSGKAITVRSSGGAGITIIDATFAADPGDGKPVVRCDNAETSATVLDGFTITGGTGHSTGGGQGGGMYNDGSSPTVTDCVFIANTADTGGGMYNTNGSLPTVINCAFIGNIATDDAGAMYNTGASNATVTNCTFSGNSATDDGGGMYNLGSLPDLTNCTFSQNTATSLGGGMYNTSSSNPTMTNCIFWDNTDTGGMDSSAQIHTASGFPVVNASDIQGGWTGNGSTNIAADPLFVDADGADNTIGTEDDDLRLSPGSPCIDAGVSGTATGLTDLDGNPRISGCSVDMGAFERQIVGNPPVHNLTQNTFFNTLQAATDAAVTGDVIEAQPCTYYEIIDFKGKAFTLQSADPTNPSVVAATIIDAGPVIDPGAGKPVVRCDSGEGPGMVLDGFTITGGTGHSTGGSKGGGMYINGSSPTVTRCTFNGNAANNGGGIYSTNPGSPTVTNCLFSNNSALFNGGGVYITGSSAANVTNCQFDNNDANVLYGGGMFLGSNCTVMDCTFSGNTAAQRGGGMYNGSNSALTNCVFNGNDSSDSGGGMFNQFGQGVIANCAFVDNSANNDGGGIYDESTLNTFLNCTFSGNSANDDGGGIFINNIGFPNLINCIFSGNTAVNNGGGMVNAGGSFPTMANCTFAGNTAMSDGGGIHNTGNSNPAVTNCVFWDNADSGGSDESAQVHTASGTPVVNFSDVQGGWTGSGSNNINADPLFVDADGADNTVGTDDDDLHLQVASPCVDVGLSSAASEQTDFDGNPRIVGCSVDMGAYEDQTAVDPPVHNLTQGIFFGTLQAAIDAANDNDVIEAQPCTFYEIITVFEKTITLQGTEPTNPMVVAATIIDAGPVASTSSGKPVVWHFVGAGGEILVLDGFTITGGTGNTTFGTPRGGGMFNWSGSPTGEKLRIHGKHC